MCIRDSSLTEHLVLARPGQRFFVDWKENQAEMGERIKTYQIVGRPETTADALSGGNQQRLLFSLLNAPLKLLLLEHPTRGDVYKRQGQRRTNTEMFFQRLAHDGLGLGRLLRLVLADQDVYKRQPS